MSKKMSAYNSFIHRLLPIPLNKQDFHDELNTIKHIAQRNGYQSSMIDKLLRKHMKRTSMPRKNKEINKFVSIEYSNIVPMMLKNTFNKHKVNITYRTNNNVQKILRHKRSTPTERKSGIYRINCNDCDRFYIGQPGRALKERFKEHLPHNNMRKMKSNYAQHLIDYNHSHMNFDNNLTPLHYCVKGRSMNAIEELEIYKEFRHNPYKLLNDQLSFQSNDLYDTALGYQDRSGQ